MKIKDIMISIIVIIILVLLLAAWIPDIGDDDGYQLAFAGCIAALKAVEAANGD